MTQIAAQMYTLREYCKTPTDIATTLAKVKKIGFEAIQISGFGPCDPKEVAKMLADNGLICCATHTSFERMQKEPQAVIDELKLWGCKHTAPGGLPGSYKELGANGYVQFAKDADAVAEIFAASGITLSYHNHNWEFEKFSGRVAQAILIEESKKLCFEIDTFWVQAGGGDPAAWIAKCGGRIPLLHCKDMTHRKDKYIMAEVGEGNLNWPAIIAAAKTAGVQWFIIEQDTCETDPFDCLATSLKNLKGMGVA
jgi:sugar phosphate isomerase/epimerase